MAKERPDTKPEETSKKDIDIKPKGELEEKLNINSKEVLEEKHDWMVKIIAAIIIILLLSTLIFKNGLTKLTPSKQKVVKTKKYSRINICANAYNTFILPGESREVDIRPDCWSGKISPELYHDFNLEAPGKVEYCFWANNRCAKRSQVRNRDAKWLGNIRASSFRLRGKRGIATITVE